MYLYTLKIQAPFSGTVRVRTETIYVGAKRAQLYLLRRYVDP